VARAPFSHSIWDPFATHLQQLSVDLRLQEEALGLQRADGSEPPGTWQLLTSRGSVQADGVVLALTVPALQSLVQASPALDDPVWRAAVAAQRLTHPFAVWRLWLDGPLREGRAPFVGTTGVGVLDNISLFHLFEDESREWSARHGGSVVELHAYAVDPGADEAFLRQDMLEALHHFYPETQKLRIVDQYWLLRQDCPAFAPGCYSQRLAVETPHEGITVAGDLVKLPIPSALMERAAASGFLAANTLLSRLGVRPEPIESVPQRGILAGLPLG
jgi:isorenieratene synthase